jgi:uncharacterized protein GlcG (DUF336 family)
LIGYFLLKVIALLIGAIGVSGSSVENDHLVAQAGVEFIGLSDLPEQP